MRSLPLLLLGVLLSANAMAGGGVIVDEAWVRASLPQQSATGAFMRLTASRETTLVSASSPAAGVAEIHEMKMVDNVARMQRVQGIRLRPGETLELRPGGYHIMLMEFKAPLQEGRAVPITLQFQAADGSRESLEVEALTRPLNARATDHHRH